MAMGSQGPTGRASRYQRKLETSEIPEYARAEVERQLRRLEVMDEGSPEYRLVLEYLDGMIRLPWGERLLAEERSQFELSSGTL
jgi:ATP-dependent Lon protease